MLGFGCKIGVSLRWIGEICAVVGDQLVLRGWLAYSLLFCSLEMISIRCPSREVSPFLTILFHFNLDFLVFIFGFGGGREIWRYVGVLMHDRDFTLLDR